MFRIIFAYLVFCGLLSFAMAQPQQQQASPQQVVTSLVNQQAQLNANITTALNQLPDLIKQVQDLQKENTELKAQLDAAKKKEVKK